MGRLTMPMFWKRIFPNPKTISIRILPPTFGNGTGIGSAVPVQVQGLESGVEAIAAGLDSACAVVNREAVCWGDNTWGQLGDGTTVDSSVPVRVQGLDSGIEAIAASGAHTCALVNGSVRCWGDNWSGELGDGTTTASLVPSSPVQFR